MKTALRITLLILLPLWAAAFWFMMGEPSVQQWQDRHYLISALQQAKSVQVMEYAILVNDKGERREVELNRVTLRDDQVLELASATTVFLASLPPGGSYFPIIHYHHIEIIDRDGSRVGMNVSLDSGTYSYSSHKNRNWNMPKAWHDKLRSFFTEIGLPPKTDEECQRLAERKEVEAIDKKP